ncbi:hypothetical protein [Azospirillum halopraeferens]|uniref:hypothetical protein n=1 Tax=Azospirillum halopraeferens TaxID=34010 RepID=UPI00040A894C|nr:hypothetical protein [Azospirillum halopraeferens]
MAPLTIEVPRGGRRIVAALVIGRKGIAFADDGWSNGPSYHPMHVVEGQVAGDGPWIIGAAQIREIGAGDSGVQLHWNDWRRSAEPSKRGRAEALLREMLAAGGLL